MVVTDGGGWEIEREREGNRVCGKGVSFALDDSLRTTAAFVKA